MPAPVTVTTGTPKVLFVMSKQTSRCTFQVLTGEINVCYNGVEVPSATVGERFVAGQGRDFDKPTTVTAIAVGASATVKVTPFDNGTQIPA